MIPLYFNENTLEVKVPKTSLTNEEYEAFITHTWVKNGRNLINHWLAYALFVQHHPELEFNRDVKLDEMISNFIRCYPFNCQT